MPSEFGFPIALDPYHPETLYVVVEDGEARQNVGQQFTVYRSGKRRRVRRATPCSMHGYKGPLRVYVGTTTGQLFASIDQGDGWHLIAEFLPLVYSLTAAVL